jgi:hypothetical protein
MKTKVFEIDADTVQTFFGEDQHLPVSEVGEDHGELIWEGSMPLHPDAGDALVIADEEYVVICRIYQTIEDGLQSTLLVHPRLFVEVELS